MLRRGTLNVWDLEQGIRGQKVRIRGASLKLLSLEKVPKKQVAARARDQN